MEAGRLWKVASEMSLLGSLSFRPLECGFDIVTCF